MSITDYRKQIPIEKVDDYTVYLEPVYTKHASGANKKWQIIVRLAPKNSDTIFAKIDDSYWNPETEIENLNGWIKVFSGHVGGKIRDSVPTIVASGKNLNRKNKTNVFCQALRDALSLRNKQQKKSTNYSRNDNRLPPMLATTAPDLQELQYPIFAQIKYNGIRCVAMWHENRVVLYSRKMHDFAGFSAIRQELYNIMPKNVYFDGELYSHGMKLQMISGYARRQDEPIADENYNSIKYIVYDSFRNDQREYFEDRLKRLKSLRWGSSVVLAPTYVLSKPPDVKELYKSVVADGYEGIILRKNSYYVHSYNDYHTDVLLKLKPKLDGEFKVVGFKCGKRGKDAGALIIVCETADGVVFTVRPSLSLEERQNLYNRFNTGSYFNDNYLNKYIVVEYAELSKDGVPSQPQTKLLIRDLKTDEYKEL